MFTYPISNGTPDPLIDIKSGMLAYYEMNVSDVPVVDSHGYGPNIANKNAGTSFAAGLIGNSVTTADAGYSFSVHRDQALSSRLHLFGVDFTIVMWIKPATLAANENLLWRQSGSLGYSMVTSSGDGTKIGVLTNADTLFSTDSITAGAWNMITYTRQLSPQRKTVSINAQAPTVTTSYTADGSSAYAHLIWGTTTNSFVRQTDITGFWNRILNEDEITALYNGGAGVAYADLPV